MLYLQIKRLSYQQIFPKDKKLVAVSETSTSITKKIEEKKFEWYLTFGILSRSKIRLKPY